jgi:hypothetical protein
MKKILAYPSCFALNAVATAFFAAPSVWLLTVLADAFIEHMKSGAVCVLVLIVLVSLAHTGLFAGLWSYYCSVIRVENGILTRRGLFGGFRFRCLVEDILRVELKKGYRGIDSLCLFIRDPAHPDGSPRCLRIQDTPAHRRFLATFWGGGIRGGW